MTIQQGAPAADRRPAAQGLSDPGQWHRVTGPEGPTVGQQETVFFLISKLKDKDDQQWGTKPFQARELGLSQRHLWDSEHIGGTHGEQTFQDSALPGHG